MKTNKYCKKCHDWYHDKKVHFTKQENQTMNEGNEEEYFETIDNQSTDEDSTKLMKNNTQQTKETKTFWKSNAQLLPRMANKTTEIKTTHNPVIHISYLEHPNNIYSNPKRTTNTSKNTNLNTYIPHHISNFMHTTFTIYHIVPPTIKRRRTILIQ